MRNHWIIGDIHGEIRLLNQLLDQILRFSPERIVFVGDYIDRGPYSREVIERIMSLEVETVFLMGNHEMMMLNAMADLGYGYSPIELWYNNGGEATLHSFGFTSFFNFQSDMDPRHMDFFRNLEMSHSIELTEHVKILATHAGISPAIPVSDHIGIKNFGELHRYMLEKHIAPDDSFLWVRDSFFDGDPRQWEGHLVVHGHTPVLKLKRFVSSRGRKKFLFVENDLCIRRDETTGRIVSIDIDSGSVISGRLSGLGFFVETEGREKPVVRMRSMTVAEEDIFPRDLGLVDGQTM